MVRKQARPLATQQGVLALLQSLCRACGSHMRMGHHSHRTVTVLQGVTRLTRHPSIDAGTPPARASINRRDQRKICHFHYLREATKPIAAADLHAKKELKKQVRGVRPLERALEERTDDEADWRTLRQTLDYRHEGRRKQLRFHRDPQTYLASLEECLCRSGLPFSEKKRLSETISDRAKWPGETVRA